MSNNDWHKYRDDPETKKNIDMVDKITSNVISHFFLMALGGWFSVIMTLCMFVGIFYILGFLMFTLVGLLDVADNCINEMISAFVWIVKNCSGIGVVIGIVMAVCMPFSKK